MVHAFKLFGTMVIPLIIALSATVGYSLPVGCGGTKKLTASAGETLRLPTGFSELHGEYSVSWFLKNDSGNHILVHFEAGDLKQTGPNLDRRTGELTLGPLRVKDSGVYEGEITNGNNGVCRVNFEVSVSEAGSSSGSSPNTAKTLSPCLVVLLAAVLVSLLFH